MMIKNNIKRIGGVGWAIDQLLERYKMGEIKGVMFQTLNNDGSFSECRGGDLSYIEKMGLLEAAKDDFRIVRAGNIDNA